MAARNSTVDWQRIEIEYCANEDSIREIADRHGISDTAIRKRAKSEKWVRKVRSANRRELVPKSAPPPPSDPEKPIEASAIADGVRSLAARMLDELDIVTTRRGELEDMIIAATEGDEDDARRDAMMRALSLTNRSNVLKTLALTLKTANEASAPQGVKAQRQEAANALADRFRPIGPPTLKSVK